MKDARRPAQPSPAGAEVQALPQLYDLARATVARRGFDAELQTKISLFIGATTSVNAALVAPGLLQGQTNVAYPFIHGQYFRELEFASLLGRLTRWTMNPSIYAEGAALTAPLWAALWQLSLAAGAARGRSAFEALAFGHALLGRVRISPIIPESIPESDPYVVALQRIEQENARMIQAQIRLLKDAKHALGASEREQIVEERQAMVDALFVRFLGWIAGPGVAPG